MAATRASAAADIAAGQSRAEVCQACHGAQGVSENPEIPSLAGQQDKLLQWQLVFFRSGRRANKIMGPMAADLSDEDVRNLGAYFASLPAGTPSAQDIDPALALCGPAVAQPSPAGPTLDRPEAFATSSYTFDACGDPLAGRLFRRALTERFA